jgi:hypothetical protein
MRGRSRTEEIRRRTTAGARADIAVPDSHVILYVMIAHAMIAHVMTSHAMISHVIQPQTGV